MPVLLTGVAGLSEAVRWVVQGDRANGIQYKRLL